MLRFPLCRFTSRSLGSAGSCLSHARSLPPTVTGGARLADQQRWFKLWVSVLTDDALQALPPAERWAWAALGAHTKQSGTKGRITISLQNAALAGAMGVTVEDLHNVMLRLPHMRVERVENRHDEVIVTWDNWIKYQIDSTQAQRAKTSRSKKRREEKREEVPSSPTSPSTPSGEKTPRTVAHATGSNGPRPSANWLAPDDALWARLKDKISLKSEPPETEKP
jgi:hypothetical protein